ncbi:hypothetical protein BT63DRAFT_284063 [Microthyrium microscopicum]|uniref:Uncharacterized protein n=1 Tax=Microthyrium microscopicum TaxID=703497 RepID=A0A6A6UBB2_9PEZI|nr:hypothetical protein BT63DRAFT_284063 [Microthyrium microscopicum]
MAAARTCQALSLSDDQKCTSEAKADDHVFCYFHAKQVQGLYMGYKKRNAKLDDLAADEPQYLAKSKLESVAFDDIKNDQPMREICNHLHKKHVLLTRVIQARRWHHDHFYPMKLDYGHESYVNKLTSDKSTVLRALERAERRLAEILFSKQKWYEWSRKCQDEDDIVQEQEKKKVQLGHAMFKRQVKQLQARMQAMRDKENERRQEAFLEQAYQERLQEDEDEDNWDPIEDELYDRRIDYMDLVKYFLWMNAPETDDESNDANGEAESNQAEEQDSDSQEDTTESQEASKPGKSSGKPSVKRQPKPKSKKKGKKKKKATSGNGPKPRTVALRNQNENGEQPSSDPEPDKAKIESRDEMTSRLRIGSDVIYEGFSGYRIAGTFEHPFELMKKNASLPRDEIEQLLKDIAEVKELLFCRLLLSHASLLPAALEANSVVEFLANPDVSETDLRDLCLRLEQPDLQEIRDACADLHRPEEEEVNVEHDKVVEDEVKSTAKEPRGQIGKQLFLLGEPEKWKPKGKNKPAMPSIPDDTTQENGGMVDFGTINDRGVYTKKIIKVKLCGRYIWNYASNTSMTRKGWYHFSIMVKDHNLFDAIRLCRTWDEAYELSMLSMLHYFPSSNWQGFAGSVQNEQLQRLGIFVYFACDIADSPSIQRGFGGMHVELRSFICCHMKRHDPVTRRFLQYVVMASNAMGVLVRDGKSGEIITKSNDNWLVRVPNPYRSSEAPWKFLKEVDSKFFEEMEAHRKWHFGFEDYYDVYLWDRRPGLTFINLYDEVQRLAFKARRIAGDMKEAYQPMAHILKTLTRDQSKRPRDLKPGEEASTLWDELQSESFKMLISQLDQHPPPRRGLRRHDLKPQGGLPPGWAYSEADLLEDLCLFEEETTDPTAPVPFKGAVNSIDVWESSGISMKKFLFDLDSDDDTDFAYSDFDELEEADAAARAELDQAISIDSEDENDESWVSGDELTDDDDELVDLMQRLWHPDATPEEVWAAPRRGKPRKNWREGYESILLCLAGYIHDPRQAPAFLKRDPAFRSLRRWDEMSERQQLMSATESVKSAVFQKEMVDTFNRDKSHQFKRAFHAGDLEPGAQAKYAEVRLVLQAIDNSVMQSISRARNWIPFVYFLNLTPDHHKHVMKDMARAYISMTPFFPELPTFSLKDFYDLEEGLQFKSSELLNAEKRAQQIPDRRRHDSNRYMDLSLWSEWFDFQDRYAADTSPQRLPPPGEWESCVRTTVAKLYKAGVIGPRSCGNNDTAGQALAAREPGRDWDLYFDIGIRECQSLKAPDIFVDPTKYVDLLDRARNFKSAHRKARFALLRTWSAPHFWPLMIAFDNRRCASFYEHFADRTWEWKFVPKDMVGAEWSMHHSLGLSLKPYDSQFRKNIARRRDIILVMGENEEELAKMCTCVTYAVQDRPWLREIDLWKSFINVDLEFLEGLDKYWLL